MTFDPQLPTSPAAPTPAPAPAVAVAVKPRAKSGGILNLLLIGAAIVAIGGVAFAVGRSTAPASAVQGLGANGGGFQRPGASGAPGIAGGGGGGGGGLGGGISVDGTVTAVDADSLTLTLDNGNDVTFTLDGTTTYREATDAAADAVAVGDQVSVGVLGGGRGAAAGGQATTPTARDVTVAR